MAFRHFESRCPLSPRNERSPLVALRCLRRWSPEQFRATLQGYLLPASLVGMLGYWPAGLWVGGVTATSSSPCPWHWQHLPGRNGQSTHGESGFAPIHPRRVNCGADRLVREGDVESVGDSLRHNGGCAMPTEREKMLASYCTTPSTRNSLLAVSRPGRCLQDAPALSAKKPCSWCIRHLAQGKVLATRKPTSRPRRAVVQMVTVGGTARKPFRGERRSSSPHATPCIVQLAGPADRHPHLADIHHYQSEHHSQTLPCMSCNPPSIRQNTWQHLWLGKVEACLLFRDRLPHA